jgi:hypothetical protein
MIEKDINKAIKYLSRIQFLNMGFTIATADGHIAFVAVGAQVKRNGHPDGSGYIK